MINPDAELYVKGDNGEFSLVPVNALIKLVQNERANKAFRQFYMEKLNGEDRK